MGPGILVAISLPGPVSSANSGCSVYQAGGRSAVARVPTALSAATPGRQVPVDLSQAAGTVNAAAQAQDVGVRSALSALTGDLQEGLREVRPRQAAPATVGTTLSSDSAALAKLCP